MFFGAAGEDGSDAGDAEFGGLLDGPLEVVELEDGEQQMEWEGGVGFEFFVKGEEDFVVGDAGDFGAVEEAVGDDVEDLAGFGAEDAGEVGGLVAGEGGVVEVQLSAIQRRRVMFSVLCCQGFGTRGWWLASRETCCGGWW